MKHQNNFLTGAPRFKKVDDLWKCEVIGKRWGKETLIEEKKFIGYGKTKVKALHDAFFKNIK